MNEPKLIILRPSARTLIVYYAIAACFGLAFVLLALIAALDPTGGITVDPWVCVLGVMGGMGIAGIVAWIHLEMKLSVYTITETQAQTRWGLLFKRNDFVQLGAVKSITVRQNPVQRVFNTGDLVLHNTSHSVLVLWDVAQPETKREEIWEMVLKGAPWSRSRYWSGR